MDPTVIAVLGVIVGAFVGLAGWLAGRDKKISADAEWKGNINSKLDTMLGIRSDVCDLREEVKNHGQQIAVLGSRMAQTDGRIGRLEERPQIK